MMKSVIAAFYACFLIYIVIKTDPDVIDRHSMVVPLYMSASLVPAMPRADLPRADLPGAELYLLLQILFWVRLALSLSAIYLDHCVEEEEARDLHIAHGASIANWQMREHEERARDRVIRELAQQMC